MLPQGPLALRAKGKTKRSIPEATTKSSSKKKRANYDAVDRQVSQDAYDTVEAIVEQQNQPAPLPTAEAPVAVEGDPFGESGPIGRVATLIGADERPKRIGQVSFSLLGDAEVRRSSVVRLHRKELHQDSSSTGREGGPLDPRLGISDKAGKCSTCGLKLAECVGHFGYVDLVLPVFHIGYFRSVKSILEKICKTCGRVLVPEPEYSALVRQVQAGGGRRKRALARVAEVANKSTYCYRCSALNGSVKKMNALVLIHDTAALDKNRREFSALLSTGETLDSYVDAQAGDVYVNVPGEAATGTAGAPSDGKSSRSSSRRGSSRRNQAEEDENSEGGAEVEQSNPHSVVTQTNLMDKIPQQYRIACAENKELQSILHKASCDLTPLHVRALLEAMSSEDCELLGLDPVNARPEYLVTKYVLAPPVCVRPSVRMDPPQGSNEDDVTMKLSEIVQLNSIINRHVTSGTDAQTLKEAWEHLQLQYAMLINSDLPGMKELQPQRKQVRGFCQRLKGKGGRFRGNLSGKRVDFSSRTVISPDPNLAIDQVAIPRQVAMVLTFSEAVTNINKARMRALVRAGPTEYPGANFVELVVSDGGKKRWLKYGDRDALADSLRPGDIVERHLCDGDVVLFNRQPSLHRVSIMALRIRVLPGRTFRFNECVCAPFNADFDGDEMNLHVPQTFEAKSEAIHLMGVQNNLAAPRTGGLLVAATQDFLSASYLLTLRDTLFDRATFCQLVGAAWYSEVIPERGSSATSSLFHVYKSTTTLPTIAMPEPAILKPLPLWTGKQLFTVLLGEDSRELSFDAESKTYKGVGEAMCPRDGYVVVRRGELLAGVLDKITLGGSKFSFFSFLNRERKPDAAARAMARMSRLCARYIGERGLSIGLTDVEPSEELSIAKTNEMADGFATTRTMIAQYEAGELKPQPGCTEEETLEGTVTSTLSELRDRCGKLCIERLPRTNAPLIMATCGSKGSTINISQMIACVGQQTVSGNRVPNGFERRSLPHFERDDRSPGARGFVSNSFYSGLEATEFFFHTMGGREGLVDTAVKTAETGYLQRKMVKALEDLSVQYDGTVRGDGGSALVQFRFGEDALDPMAMDGGKGKPIAFWSMLRSVQVMHPLCAPTEPMGADELFEVSVDLVMRLGWGDVVNRNPEEARAFAKEALLDTTGKLSVLQLALDEWRGPQPYHIASNAENSPSVRFMDDLFTFLRQVANKAHEARERAQTIAGDDKAMQSWILRCAEGPVSREQFDVFVETMLTKLQYALVEPGTAVGGLAAQSIGEPATQMTLKTFHFAGVASMNVTLGVPRIREILNATKAIATPIITAFLTKPNVNDTSAVFGVDASEADRRRQHALARRVKLRIAPVRLEDVCSEMAVVANARGAFVRARLSPEALVENGIPADAEVVAEMARNAATNTRSFKYKKADKNLSASKFIDWRDRAAGEEEALNEDQLRELAELIKTSEQTRQLIGFVSSSGSSRSRASAAPVAPTPSAAPAAVPVVPAKRRRVDSEEDEGEEDAKMADVTPAAPAVPEPAEESSESDDDALAGKGLDYTGKPVGAVVLSRRAVTPVVASGDAASDGDAAGAAGASSGSKRKGAPTGAVSRQFRQAEDFARTCLEREIRFYPPPPTRQEKRSKGVTLKSQNQFANALHVREARQMLSGRMDDLAASLPKLALTGVAGVQRVVISELDNSDQRLIKNASEETQQACGSVFKLLVEGGTMRDVMSVAGVMGELCSSNDVRGIETALGIEAARQSIIKEIQYTMDSYGIGVDDRHTMLLSDLMTSRGEVLGVNRYGISKMKESVLMLASFEKTTDHLFDAALRGKVDKITGVSESIIMGTPVPLGTGAFSLLAPIDPWRSTEVAPPTMADEIFPSSMA